MIDSNDFFPDPSQQMLSPVIHAFARLSEKPVKILSRHGDTRNSYRIGI
jgi:hypothetical protein